jgi:hypothetical protein
MGHNDRTGARTYRIFKMEESLPVGATGTHTNTGVIINTVTFSGIPLDQHQIPDVEAFFVDPVSKDGFCITRESFLNVGATALASDAQVFKITDVVGRQDTSWTAEYIGKLSDNVNYTGWINNNGIASASISDDGRYILLRDSNNDNDADLDWTNTIHRYSRNGTVDNTLVGESYEEQVPLTTEPKGEALCFNHYNPYIYYSAEEGATADITNYTHYKAPWAMDSFYGPCVYFNKEAFGPYMSFDKALNLAANNFTLLMLIKPTDLTLKNTLLGDEVNSGYIRLNTATQMRFRNSTGTVDITSADIPWTTGWQVFGLRRNGGLLNVFKNGVKGTGTGSISTTTMLSMQNIGVKARTLEMNMSDNYFGGYMKNVDLYAEALSDADVLRLSKEILYQPIRDEVNLNEPTIMFGEVPLTVSLTKAIALYMQGVEGIESASLDLLMEGEAAAANISTATLQLLMGAIMPDIVAKIKAGENYKFGGRVFTGGKTQGFTDRENVSTDINRYKDIIGINTL